MSHAPKQLALEAYARAALSPHATAYLGRHLAGCSVCSEALAQIRAYEQLRAEAADAVVPEPSWERLEAALAAGPGKGASSARTGKLIALSWPLLALAAALAIAWLGRSNQDTAAPAPHAQVNAPRASQPEPALLSGWVSLLAGSASLEHEGTVGALALESVLREGDVVSTGPGARLDVQLGPATGFALGSDASLRIERLRVGETVLALAAGRVSNRVDKLIGDAQYRVRAGELTASVRGTRFWVEQRETTAVFVHEGRVEVTRGDQRLAELTPGQGYPAQHFAAPAAAPPEDGVHLALGELSASVGLVLPPLPNLRAFLVDGAAIPASAMLAMRLPPGPTELKFEDLRGQIRSVHVDLNAPLTRLEPDALNALLAPKPMPVGYLSPEQITGVMRGAIEPLRRCYERNLRFQPDLGGKFSLHVRVSADGRVVRSEVEAREPGANETRAKLPLELERCIEMEAQKLVFPKPEGGGPLSFEVPLNLKSTR